jgi:hypothetical protein
MTENFRENWRSFALTGSYVYLLIARTLYNDLTGEFPPDFIILILMLTATTVMLISVHRLCKKLPLGTVLLLWMFPAMVFWVAFVFGRAFVFDLLGREL